MDSTPEVRLVSALEEAPSKEERTLPARHQGQQPKKSHHPTTAGQKRMGLFRNIASIQCKSFLCSALHYYSTNTALLEQPASTCCRDDGCDQSLEKWRTMLAGEIMANFQAQRKIQQTPKQPSSRKVKPVVQVVHGGKASGKTRVAQQLVHEDSCRDLPRYSRVLWIRASSRHHLTRSWRNLAISLGLLPRASQYPLAFLGPLLNGTLKLTSTRWLLVLTGLEHVSLLAQSQYNLPVRGCHCDVLILTTDFSADLSPIGRDFHTIDGPTVKQLPPEQAHAVITHNFPLHKHKARVTATGMPVHVSAARPPPVEDPGDHDRACVQEDHRAALHDIMCLTQGHPLCLAMLTRCVTVAPAMGVDMAGLMRKHADAIDTPVQEQASCVSGRITDSSASDRLPLAAIIGLVLKCLTPAAMDLLVLAAALGGNQVPLLLILLQPLETLPRHLQNALGTSWHDVLNARGMPSNQRSIKQLGQCSRRLLDLVHELEAMHTATLHTGLQQQDAETPELTAVSVQATVRYAVLEHFQGSDSCLPSFLTLAMDILLKADSQCCISSRLDVLLPLSMTFLEVPDLNRAHASSFVQSGNPTGLLQMLPREARHSLGMLANQCMLLFASYPQLMEQEQKLTSLLYILDLLQGDASPQAEQARNLLEKRCRVVLNKQPRSTRAQHADKLLRQLPKKIAVTVFPPLLQFGAHYTAQRFQVHTSSSAGMRHRPMDAAAALCINPSAFEPWLASIAGLFSKKKLERLRLLFQDIIAGFLLLLELLPKRITALQQGRTPTKARELSEFQKRFDPMCNEIMDLLQHAVCKSAGFKDIPLPSRSTKTAAAAADKWEPMVTWQESRSASTFTSRPTPKGRRGLNRRTASGLPIAQKLARFAHDCCARTGAHEIQTAVATLLGLHALALLVGGDHAGVMRETERSLCVNRFSRDDNSQTIQTGLFMLSLLKTTSCIGAEHPPLTLCDALD
ncbi:uncharacterized protein LOC135809343 [Sycon ciliatum]|uniref:uncharacterized protein LOC135809343 n=1 Tax=Sycon ciliatum TaxID=27933 RepID=UPI0031F6F0B7